MVLFSNKSSRRATLLVAGENPWPPALNNNPVYIEVQKKYFSLSLLPSFFAFLASFFFSLAEHLVGLIFVARVFRKAFRILGLGERKGRWVMEQDFHGDFQVNVTWFFASFSGVLD